MRNNYGIIMPAKNKKPQTHHQITNITFFLSLTKNKNKKHKLCDRINYNSYYKAKFQHVTHDWCLRDSLCEMIRSCSTTIFIKNSKMMFLRFEISLEKDQIQSCSSMHPQILFVNFQDFRNFSNTSIGHLQFYTHCLIHSSGCLRKFKKQGCLTRFVNCS